jgi:excisionase family DNA binding protein
MSASRTRILRRRLSYSIKRLATECDVSRSILYEEIAAGRLVAHKVGRRTIIRHADANRWLRALPTIAASKCNEEVPN